MKIQNIRKLKSQSTLENTKTIKTFKKQKIEKVNENPKHPKFRNFRKFGMLLEFLLDFRGMKTSRNTVAEYSWGAGAPMHITYQSPHLFPHRFYGPL